MVPDVSQVLAWLEKRLQALEGIQRELEHEILRVDADDTLATADRPEVLGSALMHEQITTDFAGTSLKFITPVDDDTGHMLTLTRDLHRYAVRNMGGERI